MIGSSLLLDTHRRFAHARFPRFAEATHIIVHGPFQFWGKYYEDLLHEAHMKTFLTRRNGYTRSAELTMRGTVGARQHGNEGKTVSFTCTQAATNKYHCEHHPYMKGTIVVTQAFHGDTPSRLLDRRRTRPGCPTVRSERYPDGRQDSLHRLLLDASRHFDLHRVERF
jgi:hypothetical protein